MGDETISAGEAISRLMRNIQHCLYVSDDDWRYLMSICRSDGAYFRGARKAKARSRRNNGTVKRYAHGRTQRTRRKR